MSDATDTGALDDFAERVARPLRAAEQADETFDARVMSAVYAEARARQRTAAPAAWWRRERAVRLSPLGTLALAAGLTGLVALGALGGRLTAPAADAGDAQVAAVPGTPAETLHVVRFVFSDSQASSVSLVGDFNGWERGAMPLQASGQPGLWTVSVEVPSGRYEYAFVVERESGERWVADPLAPAVRDEFGGEASVLTVAKPQYVATAGRTS